MLSKIRLTLLLAVTLLGLTAFDCNKKDGSDDRFTGHGPAATRHITDKGVQLKAYRDIPASYKPVVDDALTHAFDIAKAAGYKDFPEHSMYTVGFWDRSSKCIAPGFLIKADGTPWDQTEYDKDPRQGTVTLCIAGITFYGTYGDNNPTGTFGMLVVNDLGTLPNVVWFEAEHEILLYADRIKYGETIGVHAHPLIVAPGISSVLAAEMKTQFTAFMYELPQDIKDGDQLIAAKGTKACLLLVK